MRSIAYKIRMLLIGVFVSLSVGAIAQIGGGPGISAPPLSSDPTFTSLTVNDNVDASMTMLLDNDSTGTSNGARLVLVSSSSAAHFRTQGPENTAAIVTNGPTGAQVVVNAFGSYPMVFATANTERMRIESDGAIRYGGNAGPIYGPVQFVRKTADTCRASTTTLTADPDLDATVLQNVDYQVEAFIMFDIQNAAADFKFFFDPTAVDISEGGYHLVPTSNLGTGSDGNDVFGGTKIVSATVAGDRFMNIYGLIEGHSTADRTLQFKWAQNTSNATATCVRRTSWVKLTRIN